MVYTKNKIRINKICMTCGKEFEVMPFRKDTAKYCSLNCINVGRQSWNKGLKGYNSNYPRSVEWKQKISDSNKQRFIDNPQLREESSRRWKLLYSTGKIKSKAHGNAKGGFREDIGHYVRSIWEANICRIFNFLNIKYQYEPEVFEMKSGKSYRPDFYLPEKDLWIEVKGFFRRKYEKENIDEFQKNHNLLLIDQGCYNNLYISYNKFINFEESRIRW